MWKALDRIVSAIIRRLFKPKYHVERVERYQLPGRLRIVKWCAAPADAPEDELRRIFSIVDEPHARARSASATQFWHWARCWESKMKKILFVCHGIM